MEERQVIVQRIKAEGKSSIDRAKRYYSVLLALNGIHLPELELNLLAFTASRGTISSGGAKKQFCEMFNTTKASIGNTIYKLTRKGLLIKINNRTKVIDQLQIDFNKDLLLNIKIAQNAS